MMDMSERENDLVLAAQAFLKTADLSHDNLLRKEAEAFLSRVLRAYEPKPEAQPIIPNWLLFAMKNGKEIDKACNSTTGLTWLGFNAAYDVIRQATAKGKANGL